MKISIYQFIRLFCVIPVIDVGRVVEWALKAALAVGIWLAWKVLSVTLFMVILPMALFKAWSYISEQVSAFVTSQMQSGDLWSGSMVELTGLAAWLADCFKFQACFTVLASALIFKFAMSFIRK